jgi:hypothetical protein
MIYFIETEGMVKIGYSNDPRRRFHNLSIGCPTRCTLVAVIEGGKVEEKRIHEMFKADRIRGEWFKFTVEINTFMRERALPLDSADAAKGADESAHPLAQYLDANGIGIAEFGAKVGISRCQLWRIMTGQSTTLDTMFTLVEATNGDVSVDDFMEVWAAKRRMALEVAA